MSLRFRFDHYQTKGLLFAQAKEELIEYRLNERLWGLFLELIKVMETIFDGIDCDELIKKLLNDPKAAEIIYRILPQQDVGKQAT